jgi:hypothetical protein
MNETGGLEDFDPGAPQAIDEAPAAENARRANLGADGQGDLPKGEPGLEGLDDFGHPGILSIDIAKARDFLLTCMRSNPRVKYGLGAKVAFGATPGRDFQAIDCSGFVRETIRRSTTLGSRFPDGSVIQHEWVKTHDFAPVDLSSGGKLDGGVRIAFLDPSDSPEKIGHVVLVCNGKTLESHGGVGPDERPWNVQGWQKHAHVYMLMPSP